MPKLLPLNPAHRMDHSVFISRPEMELDACLVTYLCDARILLQSRKGFKFCIFVHTLPCTAAELQSALLAKLVYSLDWQACYLHLPFESISPQVEIRDCVSLMQLVFPILALCRKAQETQAFFALCGCLLDSAPNACVLWLFCNLSVVWVGLQYDNSFQYW